VGGKDGGPQTIASKLESAFKEEEDSASRSGTHKPLRASMKCRSTGHGQSMQWQKILVCATWSPAPCGRSEPWQLLYAWIVVLLANCSHRTGLEDC